MHASVAFLLTAALLTSGLAAPAPAATSTGLVLKREWHRVAFGQGIGFAGLHVADIDADGEPEIVAGAWMVGNIRNRSWYVLSRRGSEYAHEWSSLAYADEIASLMVAQVDADAALEVLVGVGSRIEIYDGASRTLERTVVTGATEISGLSVADVDADGARELVFCDSQRLFIHDLATGAVEFAGAGLGGKDLDVGQADTDSALEIAVANDTSASGLLVDGQTRAVEWVEPQGFGLHVRMGDLDGDGVAEVVAGFRWSRLVVYDTTTRGIRYEIPVMNLAAVRLADVEGDGPVELVYGDAQMGELHVLDGATGAEKWQVENPGHGMTDIAIGDADDDGVVEILFGPGTASPVPYLFVVDTESRAIEWASPEESGPFYGFAFGDVDADGTPELVYSSFKSDSYQEDGVYFVHDATSKELEYRSPPVNSGNYNGVWRVRAANVDADPQLELLITSGSSYNGRIYCLDGLTHAEQWHSELPSGVSVRSLQVVDLEGDGSLEVVASMGEEHTSDDADAVYVFDAGTGALEWRSPALGHGSPKSSLLRVAQVDGDARLEIAVASHGGPLWIVDGTTRAVERSFTNLQVTALETVDRDGDGRAEVVIGTWDGKVQVVDPVTGAIQDLGSFGGPIDGLAVVDLTGDGTTDLVFCVADRLRVVDGASGLTVALTEALGFNSSTGAHDSLTVADVDGDGVLEVVVNLGPAGLMVFEAALEADTEAPSVSLVSPPPGPASGTVQIQAQASDDRGVTQVEFYLDGGLLGVDVTPPYSFPWSTTTAVGGSHVLFARAYDAAGNVGTSAEVPVVVPDLTPPAVQVTAPASGSSVSGTVTITVDASDAVGVVRVELFVDGALRGTDLTEPFSFAWDTAATTNGPHSLYARAHDAAGNSSTSTTVSVTVANVLPSEAVYDPTLRAPRCSAVASLCDSGSLLVGRGTVGPERNQPNTIGASCADSTYGSFHNDESNDRIEVSTVDGTAFAPGKTVRIRATVWAWSGYSSDKLDLYSAADALNPVWTHRGTFTPPAAGAQALTTTFTLPIGSMQAVRARFRYSGTAAACGAGSYIDHDDLVFAVGEGSDLPPVVSITAPAAGATVGGIVGVEAAASDASGVTRVDFLVDGLLRFQDTVAPWSFAWDTRSVADGAHSLVGKAYDPAGNAGQSAPITVTVQNGTPGNAVFDSSLKVPSCPSVGSACDSGTLLLGRGSVGPEPNQPNSIGGSCADGSAGTFHYDESNDRLKVATVDGTPLAAGKSARIEATVWAWPGSNDHLDLYYSARVDVPTWVYLTTIPTTKVGAQTLSTIYTLPTRGGLQAIRARFRFGGSSSPCSAGLLDDHDDLVFAVQP